MRSDARGLTQSEVRQGGGRLPSILGQIRKHSLALISLLLIGLVLFAILFPWTHPAVDVTVNKFDADYIYQSPSGGSLEVTTNSILLSAPSSSEPSAIIATSDVSYSSSVDATVLAESIGSIPLVLSVYAPLVLQNASISFRSSDHSIILQVSQTNETILGTYTLLVPTRVSIEVKVGESLFFSVSNSAGTTIRTLTGDSVAQLLQTGVRALEVATFGSNMTGSPLTVSQISNPQMTILHSPWTAPRISDWRIFLVYPVLVILSGILIASRRPLEVLNLSARMLLAKLERVPRNLWLVLLVGLVTRILLFGVGHHPYDIYVESVWTKAVSKDGVSSIYGTPSLVTAAPAFNGIPFLSSFYPYPPFLAYLFIAVQGLHVISFQFLSIESSIKLLSGMADCTAALVVYFLVVRMGGRRSMAILASLLYLLLPAAIYDSAVWGETDSFLMLMILVTMYAFATGHDSMFWMVATLTILTKQTAALPIIAMVILVVLSTGIDRTVRGFGLSTIASLLAAAPFLAAGYSPFVLVNQTLSRISQFTVGNTPFGTPISADAYSLPPLISQFSGLLGRDRMWNSDTIKVPSLPITYSQLGALMFLSVAAPIGFQFLKEKKGDFRGLNALAMISVLTLLSFFLPTRVSGRYFVIATGMMIPPFLASGKKSMIATIGVISATTFVSMHGLLTYLAVSMPNISGIDYTNPFNGAVQGFYVSDWGITVSILVNLLAVASSIYSLYRPLSLANFKRLLHFGGQGNRC